MPRLPTLLLPCLLLCSAPVHAVPLILEGIDNPMGGDAALPLLGLANVEIRVSDLESARSFYTGVAGLEEAFDTKADDGSVTAAYFKVSDLQFVEIVPGLAAADAVSMSHIAFRTEQIEKLRAMLVERGLNPTAITKGPDGNLVFSLTDLPGQDLPSLEFVQYVPGSLSEVTRGNFLGARRLSTHLEHAGIICTDFAAAYSFYAKTLGFRDRYLRLDFERSKAVLDQLRAPGPREEFVELFNQTGLPGPVTRKRARGPVHFAMEVPDDHVVFQELTRRGMAANRAPPHYAWDNRYNTNIFDPDGTRVEFMQAEDPLHPTPLVVYTPQPQR